MKKAEWILEGSRIAALALVYLLAAKLGLGLAFLHKSASPVWPPTGIALAVLLVGGARLWPGVTLGAFIANLMTTGDWPTSLGIAVGNTLEAVVGATLVRRHAHGVAAFEQPRDFFRFVALGALGSSLLSPVIGVTSLCLGGLANWADFTRIGWTWWLGDAMGALVVAPPLVLLGRRPRHFDRPSLHAVALALLTSGIAAMVFWGRVPGIGQTAPLAFLCLPCMVWAAFRFEQRGAATAGLAIGIIAVSGTVRGYGPFASASPNTSLLILQAFLGTVTLTTLALGIVVAGRRRVAEELATHTRAKLTASEANLAKAQALAHLGSWEWNIVRDRVLWSDELHRIFGLLPFGQVLNYAGFLACVHPEDRDFVDATVRKAQRSGLGFELEYRIVRPDAVGRWVLARGDVLQRNGTAVEMHGTVLDITDQKSNEVERRRLEIELLEVSHREQLRLGQDLHEDLGQLLTGAALLSKTLEKKLRGSGDAAALGEIRALLDIAVLKTRSLARGLPEAKVLGEGLQTALQDLAMDTERRFNVCCRFTASPGSWNDGLPSTMHLYRIAQEATNNAIRHGKTAKILISLADSGPGITLAIWDDGAGYDDHDDVDNHGLRLMRYRAELLGGSLEILSAPGGNTVVCNLDRR